MKINLKRILIVLFLIVIIITISVQIIKNPKPKLELSDNTSISPARYTDSYFLKKLEENYPELFASMDNDSCNEYVIPGLECTASISSQNGKIGICKNMIPQGLALTEKYILVSAYSEDKSYNSVIYMIDKVNGDYIKTIVLPDTSHVGGIAYASHSNDVWITTNQSDIPNHAEISVLSLSEMEDYDLNMVDTAIAYKTAYSLEELPAASSLTYYNQNILVGYFRKNAHADMVRYELSTDGSLELPYAIKDKKSGEIDYTRFYSYEGMEKMQGIAVNDDYIFISQSYGTGNSNFLIMKNNGTDTWSDFDDDEILGRMECPSYLEQIACDGKNVYMLFEGAANKYKHRPTAIHMDRIIKLNIDNLFYK